MSAAIQMIGYGLWAVGFSAAVLLLCRAVKRLALRWLRRGPKRRL